MIPARPLERLSLTRASPDGFPGAAHGHGGARPTIGVIEGRTCVPPLPRTTIHRPRLFDILDRPTDARDRPKISVVTGPAGSGKTTLLADWVKRRRNTAMPLAWLTIDQSDNSPDVFGAALARALAGTGDASMAVASRGLAESPHTDNCSFEVRLIDALTAGDGVCLVIDDVHQLDDPASLTLLAHLIRWAPRHCHIVLSGRFMPALSLHRTRLEGTLAVVDRRALAFTEDETLDLFSSHGYHLAATELTSLMHWTQGWAAGVQMAVLESSQAGSGDWSRDDAPCGSAAMTDYLIGEFLAPQNSAMRRLLVLASIPESFPAEMATVLSDEPEIGRQLEELATRNFLVDRSHGSPQVTYRFHPLMRRQLRGELSLLEPDTVDMAARKLVSWHLGGGRPIEALRCAVEVGNGALVENVVEQCGIDVLIGGREELVPVLERVPPSARNHSTVQLMMATVDLGRGDLLPASAILARFDRGVASHTPTEAVLVETLRMQLALSTDPISRSEVEQDLEYLASLSGYAGGRVHLEGHAFGALHAAVGEIFLDRLDSAERKVRDALGSARASRSLAAEMHAHGIRSALHVARGKLSAGERAAQDCSKLADELGMTAVVTHQIALMMSDYVNHTRMRPLPPQAMVRWTPLADSAFPATSEAASRLHALIIGSRTDRNQTGGRLTPRNPPEHDALPPALHAMLAAESQHVLLARGDTTQAHQYAAYIRALLPGKAEGAVLAAMHRYRVGRHAPASAILAPVLGGLPAAHPVTEVWAHLMLALLSESGDSKETYRSLATALEVARDEQMSRPFWLLGTPIRSLLVRHRGRFGRSESYAEHIRSLIGAATVPNTVNLSPRELQVLRELASSRPATLIAADLNISLNTAKTHLRGIYRKLGVSNRWDAVTVAEDMGFL